MGDMRYEALLTLTTQSLILAHIHPHTCRQNKSSNSATHIQNNAVEQPLPPSLKVSPPRWKTKKVNHVFLRQFTYLMISFSFERRKDYRTTTKRGELTGIAQVSKEEASSQIEISKARNDKWDEDESLLLCRLPRSWVALRKPWEKKKKLKPTSGFCWNRVSVIKKKALHILGGGEEEEEEKGKDTSRVITRATYASEDMACIFLSSFLQCFSLPLVTWEQNRFPFMPSSLYLTHVTPKRMLH